MNKIEKDRETLLEACRQAKTLLIHNSPHRASEELSKSMQRAFQVLKDAVSEAVSSEVEEK